MRVLFIDTNTGENQNIGLAYILTLAKAKNIVKVINPFSDIFAAGYGELLGKTYARYIKLLSDYIVKEVENFKPEVIGFSVTSFTFKKTLCITSLLRPLYPKISFIWGGVHPTVLPEGTIQNPLVDAICIGEGEKALPEYLDKLETGKEPNVDGIWYKDKNRNVIRNRLRPFEEDLDSLPFPDWDLWDIERHFTESKYFVPSGIKLLSSRGCPYSCSFCSNAAIRESVPGRYYRLRSPDNLIAEIKYNEQKYYAKGFKNIYFGDALFGLNIEWLIEFCNKFKRDGLHKKFSWDCGTRVDVITPEWAKNAAEAGCRWVSLGVESGDDYIRRKIYNKDFTRETIITATRNLRENGIGVGFYILLGCPYENFRSVISSLRLIYKAKPTAFHYTMYWPLPKTELVNSLRSGMWKRDKEFEEYWNIPRVVTYKMGFNKIKIAMWSMGVLKIIMIFRRGLELRGSQFPFDLFKYIFFGPRKMKLLSPYLWLELETKLSNPR